MAMPNWPRSLSSSDDTELPFSCSTNLANDVAEALAVAKLGGAAAAFCFKLTRETFGNAGNSRKLGVKDPGVWCVFRLAAWSKELGKDKSNIRRIRDDLVSCGIIWYQPYEYEPGSGAIGWNLHFEEWQPYNIRPGRTASNAAKRLEKQQGVVILTEPPPFSVQTSVVKLTEKSVKITTPDCVKITTADSLDPAPVQVPRSRLIKVTKENRRNGDTNVSPSDANASGADVRQASFGSPVIEVKPQKPLIPIPTATGTKEKKTTKPAKTQPAPEEKVARGTEGMNQEERERLKAFRQVCFGLLTQTYPETFTKGNILPRFFNGIVDLFKMGVTHEELADCWRLTLIDPYRRPTLDFIELLDRIPIYREDHAAYEKLVNQRRTSKTERRPTHALTTTTLKPRSHVQAVIGEHTPTAAEKRPVKW